MIRLTLPLLQVPNKLEYVYSWLSTFKINEEGIISKLEFNDEKLAQSNKTNILLAVKANTNTKIWEIKIFEEFFNEHFSKDELFFFLYCRNAIFNGPQLEIKEESKNMVPKISSDKIAEILDSIDIFSNNEEKRYLKGRLKRNPFKEKELKVDIYEVIINSI